MSVCPDHSDNLVVVANFPMYCAQLLSQTVLAVSLFRLNTSVLPESVKIFTGKGLQTSLILIHFTVCAFSALCLPAKV